MDYAGLDYRNIRFPVNRPLTKEEKNSRYFQKKLKDAPVRDFLSVINFNSRYIDLVDRWYSVKGFNVWVGGTVISGGMIACFLICYMLFLSV